MRKPSLVHPQPSPPAAEQWTRLWDLAGREVILGPLQQPVTVRLYDYGLGIRTRGLLGIASNGDEARFPYTALRRSTTSSEIVVQSDSPTTADRVLVGRAARVLNRLCRTVGAGNDHGLMATPASARLRSGLAQDGILVGGPQGMILFPTGMTRALQREPKAISIRQLEMAKETPKGLLLYRDGEAKPAVTIHPSEIPSRRFAPWWAGRGLIPPPARPDHIPCLWRDHTGVTSPAEMVLVRGGIELRSIDGSHRTLRSSGLMVEIESERLSHGGMQRVAMWVRTHHQKVWFRAGFGSHETLTAHLSTHGLEAWPEDFHAAAWGSIVGAWDAIRIHPPNEAEWVAHAARLETANLGLQLVADCPPPDANTGAVPGKRVRVEVITGQTGWQFSAVVLPHTRSLSACSGEGEQVMLSLLPLDEAPTRRPHGNGAFRMNIGKPTKVRMVRNDSDEPEYARLAHLSVDGMGLTPDGPGPEPGTILRFSIPKISGGHVHVDGEVFHYSQYFGRPDGIGVRFMSVTEQVRTIIQREVLQHERVCTRSRNAIRGSRLLSDGPPPYVPVFEEDSIDLTKRVASTRAYRKPAGIHPAT